MMRQRAANVIQRQFLRQWLKSRSHRRDWTELNKPFIALK